MLKDFKLYRNAAQNGTNNMFIIVCLLHANGFINNESLNARFKQLKEGKLLRRVNTYRSNITKEWYNDETMLDIFEDVFDTKMNPKSGKERLRLDRLNKLRILKGLNAKTFKTELSFDETMKYLNLYLNRCRNYCIDHLFFEFIKPNIEKFEYGTTNLNELFNYDFSILERNNSYSSFGYDDNYYCCEYCCGDYSDWLHNREHNRYNKNKKETRKEISKLVSDFLNTKRDKFKGSFKDYEKLCD